MSVTCNIDRTLRATRILIGLCTGHSNSPGDGVIAARERHASGNSGELQHRERIPRGRILRADWAKHRGRDLSLNGRLALAGTVKKRHTSLPSPMS